MHMPMNRPMACVTTVNHGDAGDTADSTLNAQQTLCLCFPFRATGPQFRILKTHTPQIQGVKISPPEFKEKAPNNAAKQVIFEGSPPNLGGESSPSEFGECGFSGNN